MGKFSNASSVINSFEKKRERIIETVKQEVEIAGRGTEYEAKQKVPVDTGALRNSIAYEPINNGFGARITANEPYAPFIEFGTGTNVDIPDGFEPLAEQYKGNGQKQVNIPPSPYLIPAAIHQFEQLKDRLEKKLGK